jgi:luciferase family oxidoreductase group 1
MDFLDGSTPAASPFASLTAMPSGRTSPDLWVLGSSEYGALLAAAMGLPYTLAHFIAGDAAEITHAYRARFKPSARWAAPRVIVAVAAIVAATDAEAEALTWPLALWRMRLFRGQSSPVPSLQETERYPWTPRERYEVEATRRVIAGSPPTVRRKLETLVAAHGADEAMIVTITPDYASRLRSYELLADAFALSERAA